MGLTCFMFDLDAKQVVDALQNPRIYISEFGSPISSIYSILNNERSFHVSFARRQANKVARALAKATRFRASPTTRLSAPICIEPLILEDCKVLLLNKIAFPPKKKNKNKIIVI
ncbi:hypothetical protein DITRI_Ditri17bG0038000 [Diplodiscus trichospermus]